LFQFLSVGLITLASLAIVAHNCDFQQEMRDMNPMVYMMYLLYFNSASCTNFIQWDRLGIQNPLQFQPLMPDETEAVTRTFVFAIFYVIFHTLLLMASINLTHVQFNCCSTRAMAIGRKRHSSGRSDRLLCFGLRFSFWM